MKRPLSWWFTALGLRGWVAEQAIAPPRRFRLDFAFPEHKLGIEVEGGLWSRNPRARAAHAMPLAILRDMEKQNYATLHGWRLLRFTPEQVESGAAVLVVQEALRGG